MKTSILLSTFSIVLLMYGSRSLANSKCENVDVQSAYSTANLENSVQIKTLRTVFSDINISENLFVLLKTYITYASQPNFNENSYNLSDEFNFTFNQKQKNPNFNGSIFKKLKLANDNYVIKIGQYGELDSKDRQLLDITLDFALFLIERNSEIKSNFSNLSLEDIFSIYSYTKHMFLPLNSYLYSDKQCDKFLDFTANKLNEALNKIPVFKGIVNRSINPYENFVKDHCNQCDVNYKGFASTSRTSLDYGESSYQLVMSINSGRDISRLSNIPNENEVLIPSSSSFKINKIDGHKIFMTETTLKLLN